MKKQGSTLSPFGHASAHLFALVAFFVIAVFVAPGAKAQRPTGSIEGVVSDATGAAIVNAKITVTQQERGRTFSTTTDSDGNYAVSALEPGEYAIQVEAPKFKTGILNVHVQVGKAATGSLTLEVGEVAETVRVTAPEETELDVSRATVGGIITAAQLENLPVDGRNFLGLASLEPGVQVVDAGGLEQTKTGFTAVSIAGSEGRTTRIQVDGIDETDEVVGTTTQNYSLDGIQGFQISEFTLDPSTSLSNTGAINLVTRSGQNGLHGSAFVFWRDHNFASRILGLDAPFHRVQGGFRAGGPVVKDKVFWFVNFEDTAQHNAVFVAPPVPFNQFTGFVASPFPEHLGTGRVDWNASSRLHVFGRFTHDDNQGATSFGGNSLSPILNKNNTNSIAAGADLNYNKVTHSFRYGHLNFADYVDPFSSPSLPNFPLYIIFDDTGVTFGPNFASRQHSLQTNDQFRYDGSYFLSGHLLQYGANYSHISANLAAAPFVQAPEADTVTAAFAGNGLDPSNPLNYVPVALVFGNGLTALSNKPSHGFSFGGITNNRVALYISDSYKTQRELTLNFGLRWEIDPGQFNGDLARPQILDTVLPGQSGHINVPKTNFGPTFGLAWNVGGRNTTVVRAGAGIYYETNIFENVLFDRAAQLSANEATQVQVLFPQANQALLIGPTCDLIFDASSAFQMPLGASISSILAAQGQLVAESQAAAGGPPNGFTALVPPCGRLPGTQNTLGALFDRHITQPYSLHTNIGVQHRFGETWLVQADVVRNRGEHTYLVRDANRFGAASTLNVPNAQQAIQATEAQFGASSIDGAIQNGATIAAFAANGLDRGFAFPGVNPQFGMLNLIGTQGVSTYQGLLLKVTGQSGGMAHVVRSASWGFSYALSRFDATQEDQANALHSHAFNNDCVTCLYGPAGEDRTHQFSVNAMLNLPKGFRWNTVTHLNSALPVTLQLPQTAPGGVGEIYFSDINGDGQGGDVLPGTNLGALGRSVDSASALNAAIANFNGIYAGQFTPAAQALINSQLFTAAELKALGAVIPAVHTAPGGQVLPDWYATTDIRLSRSFDFRERFHVEPTLDIFNVFNRINFDPPGNLLSGVLSGAPGTANGTTPGLRTNVFGLGSGSFSPGIPRSLQFGLRVNF